MILACKAKGDVRRYLNAFFIDAIQGNVVATDGHRLAFAPIADKEDIDESCIIEIKDSSIPLKTKIIEITESHLTCFSDVIATADSRIKVIPISIVDAKYPGYLKAVKSQAKFKAAKSITVNHDYIYDLTKISKQYPTLKFRGNDGAVQIQFHGELADVNVLVMPMRN